MEEPSPTSVVLEPAEQEAMATIWRRLDDVSGPRGEEGKNHIAAALVRLEKLWDAIEVHPSILRGQTLGARHRDLRSLVDTLSLASPYTVEVFLPTRASLCRTFLQAKLNFCRLLGLVASELLAGDPEEEAIARGVERVRTSAVCSIMAEDLLRMISADEGQEKEVRRKATRVLVQMWEYRACIVVPRLFPVLDSVWQAKAHVTISYGTLAGFSEVLGMLSEGCDPVFIDCFSRDEVGEDEELSLQEFVFNVSYEHLQQIQEHMCETKSSTVDATTVAKILEVPVDDLKVQTCTCEDMIFTFREREAMAAHRRAFDLPGPKRTAEQYLMTYLLELTGDGDIEACEVR